MANIAGWASRARSRSPGAPPSPDQDRRERALEMRIERGGALVERPAEDRVRLVEPRAHPGVLRALAGEQEGHPRRPRRSRRARDDAVHLCSRGERAEPRRPSPRRCSPTTAARWPKWLRPAPAVKQTSARCALRSLRQMPGEASGQLAQRRRALRRERQHVGGALVGRRRRGGAGASSTITCALVPLKPNELTPRDARRRRRRPRRRRRVDHLERQLVPGDVRVRRARSAGGPAARRAAGPARP